MIANLIDQARNAVRGAIHRLQRIGCEDPLRLPTHGADLRPDIATGFVPIEGLQVTTRRHPLIEGLQTRRGHPFVQHEARGQHQTYPGLPLPYQIRDHANLFQQPQRQHVLAPSSTISSMPWGHVSLGSSAVDQ